MEDNKNKEDAYRTALKHHDWYYEYSDDHRIWRRGSSSYSAIKLMQKAQDPDFSIWNKYAPEMYQAKIKKTNENKPVAKSQKPKAF